MKQLTKEQLIDPVFNKCAAIEPVYRKTGYYEYQTIWNTANSVILRE